jgi:hypothetical protein
LRQSEEETLLAAHAAGDEETLVKCYAAEADRLEAAGDVDAACFYLTQAYVYALHAGLAEAQDLHVRLVANGREE